MAEGPSRRGRNSVVLACGREEEEEGGRQGWRRKGESKGVNEGGRRSSLTDCCGEGCGTTHDGMVGHHVAHASPCSIVSQPRASSPLSTARSLSRTHSCFSSLPFFLLLSPSLSPSLLLPPSLAGPESVHAQAGALRYLPTRTLSHVRY
eukprot:2727936-Rhodomonas_salina.2